MTKLLVLLLALLVTTAMVIPTAGSAAPARTANLQTLEIQMFERSVFTINLTYAAFQIEGGVPDCSGVTSTYGMMALDDFSALDAMPMNGNPAKAQFLLSKALGNAGMAWLLLGKNGCTSFNDTDVQQSGKLLLQAMKLVPLQKA